MALQLTAEQRKAPLEAIARFCRIPYMLQGTLAKSGPRAYMYAHDWGNVVREISLIINPRANLDYVAQRMVGALVRDEFPNGQDWNERIKGQRPQERILAIIVVGIDHLKI